MFDEATILARLQNGEDAQTIANEMAAALNKVNKIYADQKAKEEADRAAAKLAESQKKEDLQEILDLFGDWLNAHYGIGTKGDITADQVIELIESLQEYIEALKDLEAIFGVKNAPKVVKKSVKPAANADETINQFLKNMGW
jgi:ribosome-interacting GTPase 1